jgi:hypothetical protein
LRNPSKSNVVAVVEKISALDQTATDILTLRNQVGNTDLATVLGSGTRLDSRGNQLSTLIPSSEATVGAAGSIFGGHQVPVNQSVDFLITDIDEFPILPGDQVQLRSNTAVHTVGSWWIWRERALEEGELT